MYSELIKRHGVKVSFLTYGDESDYKYRNSTGEIEIIPIYAHLNKPKRAYSQMLQTLLIPWRLGRIIKAFDVYKTNQMLGSWLPVIAKILHKKPLIVRCGYELYDFALKANKKKIYRWFVYLISQMAYKSADRIHLATQSDKSFVIDQFSVASKKIHIFPNWIDTDKYACLQNSREDKVLFVGRLNRQKNIPLLLRSLVGANTTLDIVGSGELEGDLIREAKSLGVSVNFLGNIPNHRMPEIYNNYRIYVLCSYYEGNPKTLLEAMACGCAVIGTNVSGIREIITHEENGLLVAEDENSLRDAILRLKGDRSLSDLLGREASRYVKDNNSLEYLLTDEIYAYRQHIERGML